MNDITNKENILNEYSHIYYDDINFYMVLKDNSQIQSIEIENLTLNQSLLIKNYIFQFLILFPKSYNDKLKLYTYLCSITHQVLYKRIIISFMEYIISFIEIKSTFHKYINEVLIYINQCIKPKSYTITYVDNNECSMNLLFEKIGFIEFIIKDTRIQQIILTHD